MARITLGIGTSHSPILVLDGDRWEQRRHDLERPILPPGELYLSPEELRARWNKASRIDVLDPGHAQAGKAIALPELPAPSLPWSQKGGEPGSALLGFCGLKRSNQPGGPQGMMEVGWRLREDAWGKGYAKEAATASLALAFDHFGADEVLALTVQGKLSDWDITYSGGYFERKTDNLSDYSYYTVAYDT